MKVLCIGKSNYDITIEVDDLPVGGNKYKFIEKNRCGGGSAGNVAYLLGKWGVDTVIASLMGADSYSEATKKDFNEVNVNTNFLETNFEQPSSLSIIMLNNKDHSKTVLDIATEYKPLKKYNYDFTPEFIYSDGYDYGATQNAANKYTHVPNLLDAREMTSETLELSKYMNTIIASLDFAVGVTKTGVDFNNPQSLVNMYSKFINKYPNSNVIVTLGSHGALYKNDNQIKIMPGLKVDVKDTTGSKDAFVAAYIYSIVNGFDIEKTITLANIAAGLVASVVGGRNAMPALSTVLEEYNKRKGGGTDAPVPETKTEAVKAPEPPKETQPIPDAPKAEEPTNEDSKPAEEAIQPKEKTEGTTTEIEITATEPNNNDNK